MIDLLLYGVTVLVWGSTWLAIEFQLGTVAPEVSVFYRYAAAAAILFAWCALRRRSLRFALRSHGYFALLGLCLFGLNYLLTYHAQQYITSALSAIAFSTMLWMNIINARLLFGTRVEPRVVLGSIFGLAGIVTLFYPEIEALTWSDATLMGAALSISGAIIASLGNMASLAAQRQALPVIQSQGASNQVQKQIESLGSTTIIVRSQKPPEEKLAGSRVSEYGLLRSDLNRILANVPTIESAIPIREIRRQFTYRDRSVDGRLVGCTPAYADVNHLMIRSGGGRFLTDADELKVDTVCVLSAGVAEKLFPFEEPLGKRVTIPEHTDKYKVIGVLEHRNPSAAIGGSLDSQDFSKDIY
ncbi:MAG: ABC transporter permease, partial [Pseudomonadota bacterium]